MVTKEQLRQFYANKEREPIRVKIGGKFSFSKLPIEVQKKVKESLASKDRVMQKGQAGILPGIKINGKEVSRDNIHEFEINPAKKPKKVKEKPKKEEVEEPKESLFDKSFNELRSIAAKLGIKGRSKKELISEIIAGEEIHH